MNHFLCIDDHDADRVRWLLGVAAEVKQAPESWRDSLAGRSVAVLLDRTSTRARTSLVVGAAELGAAPVVLPREELAAGGGEPLTVTAAILSRCVDLLVPVGFSQSDLEEIEGAAAVPVLNGGSSRTHPCQALADLLALREALFDLAGRRLAWVGGATPVLYSLLLAAPMLGMDVAVTGLGKGRPAPAALERARELAAVSGARIELHDGPRDAVDSADAVYLGSGARLGDDDPEAAAGEAGGAARDAGNEATRGRSSRIVVDAALLRHAGDGVRLLHSGSSTSLPDGGVGMARRPDSLMLEQVGNRLPVQKAVMLFLLEAV